MLLVVERASTPGSIILAIPLPIGDFIIGRGRDCDLMLPGASMASQHVKLVRKGSSVTFEDLDPAHETELNGVAAAEGLLSPSSTLKLGDIVLRVEIELRDLPAVDQPTDSVFDWQPFRAFVDTMRRAGDSHTLFESLLCGLTNLLRMDRGFVLLKDGVDKFKTAASVGVIDDVNALTDAASAILSRTLAAGTTVFISDTREDELCKAAGVAFVDEVGRSILCCPLEAEGKRFGLLFMDVSRTKSYLKGSHMHFFEAAAGVASEFYAAQKTKQGLMAARGRIAVLNSLAWEEETFAYGTSEAAIALNEFIQKHAVLDCPVLVTGNTGTGKEMVARALHRRSSKGEGPFVPVNCSAIAPLELEAELFGDVAADRPGRAESACSGTLFLDEVAILPLALQTKILRLLEEGLYMPLGETTPKTATFRVIASSIRDLPACAQAGEFRQDLFTRLSEASVNLVSLADRPEDIMPLADHFLKLFCRRCGKKIKGFTAEAQEALSAAPWPGNIRELKNAIERAVVVEVGEEIKKESLPHL